jgi:integration host factor subunit beta
MDQTAPREERTRKGTRPERTTTKADLVDEVARAADLTRKQAEAVVESVFDGIITSLQDGQKIELRGFGSFKIRRRGARLARNPKKSGVKVMVPPKRVPYFKPGKKLKELLNEVAEASASATRGATDVKDVKVG